MEMDKRLMEASRWERLNGGRLGLVLMGGAKLSKSFIQFSVDGWCCVPSMLFDLGSTGPKPTGSELEARSPNWLPRPSCCP